VDSLFSGYGSAVLCDGKWIDKGKETTQDSSSADRLGNKGNTWVSADTETDHWIRLNWPRPVRINEVEICWSQDDWQPRAFRVEQLRDGQWLPASGKECCWAATDRRSVVPLPQLEVRSLRILQPAGGGGSRRFMAAQEVLAFWRENGARALAGARALSTAEVRRLKTRPLTRNLARLECPSAVSAIAWTADGREISALGLVDGDCQTPVRLPAGAVGFGVVWPIAHVTDGLVIAFAGRVPDAGALVAEVHDGRQWVPIRAGLRTWLANRGGRFSSTRHEWVPMGKGLQPAQPEGDNGLRFSFVPLATRAVRVRLADPRQLPAVTEIEVFRYLPPRKDVWPERLVQKGGLKDQVLAAREEPSFETLSLASLPMTPARALLGLKDAPHEIGVTWDGTILARETIRFRFGTELDELVDYRDTVRRQLIDGWRPGTVVEGRLGQLAVRQTALVDQIGTGTAALPVLFVRLDVKNQSDRPVHTSIQAEALSKDPLARFQGGALVRGKQVVLLSSSPCTAANDGRGLRVDLALEPSQQSQVDFVSPQATVTLGTNLAPYRGASFAAALERFWASWDRILSPAAGLDVPEARINRLYKAILAQLYINADGDVMPYGSQPSAYEGKLYGIEESYAMLGLAQCGYGSDAQRYLDGTFFTPDFLKKVEVYRTYAHRHQQYRNGLQPHYAVSLYRLTRDAAWIRKHLPLLKECAEWTMQQRRRTMELENGQKPLHWGLLPKWSYGGDISEVQCYALYANYCCWRGLVDTAWLLQELGERDLARRYADEARDYRAAIDRAVEASYQSRHQPPFLPLRLYATRPDEQQDYYQLFAGCLLDLAPFDLESRHLRWITDFLEEDNRVFCLLPRFRRDAGAGGLDALYGKGYLLTKLRQDAVKEFLLGFYAFLAFNLDHETFASRETNLFYASDLHLRSSYPVPDVSDPLPCSSAVALHLLRHLLIREEPAGSGEDGHLLLLSAVPRAWLRDGQKIRLTKWPTHYGPISLEVRSATASGRIEVDLDGPQRNDCRAVKLRLRHPESRPIRSITVEGKPWTDFDAAGEWITLPGRKTPSRLVVQYD
jgi:hypothetical protein